MSDTLGRVTKFHSTELLAELTELKVESQSLEGNHLTGR